MSQFCSKKVTQGKEYPGMLTHATDGSTKDEIRNPESGNRNPETERETETEYGIKYQW